MAWQKILLNPKSAGAVIKKLKPNVGSLTQTRAVKDDLTKAIDKGRIIKSKEEVKEILMKQPHGKKLHDIVKKAGDLPQKIHKSKK